MNAMDDERFFRAAGFLFTWSRVRDRRSTRLDMWLEERPGGARHWVTASRVGADHRDRLYARALALVAQVSALDVPARRDPAARAVAYGLALVQDRVDRLNAQQAAALHRWVDGSAYAA